MPMCTLYIINAPVYEYRKVINLNMQANFAFFNTSATVQQCTLLIKLSLEKKMKCQKIIFIFLHIGLADIMKCLLTKYDNLFETSFPYSMGWHGKFFVEFYSQKLQTYSDQY